MTSAAATTGSRRSAGRWPWPNPRALRNFSARRGPAGWLPGGPDRVRWSERLYRAMLLCYPAEFRYEYASEMTQVFRDRLRDESALLLWFELVSDLVLTASREHCHMLLHDLRYTARTLRKAPVFTVAAI